MVLASLWRWVALAARARLTSPGIDDEYVARNWKQKMPMGRGAENPFQARELQPGKQAIIGAHPKIARSSSWVLAIN